MRVGVELAPAHMAAKKIGIIYDVFVLDNFRRKEIGRRLVEKSLEWFKIKKVKYIDLGVDSRNEAAIKFWDSLGFSIYKFKMKLDL